MHTCGGTTCKVVRPAYDAALLDAAVVTVLLPTPLLALLPPLLPLLLLLPPLFLLGLGPPPPPVRPNMEGRVK
jgi:hypothetical protein